jgi:hypothetical protein
LLTLASVPLLTEKLRQFAERGASSKSENPESELILSNISKDEIYSYEQIGNEIESKGEKDELKEE